LVTSPQEAEGLEALAEEVLAEVVPAVAGKWLKRKEGRCRTHLPSFFSIEFMLFCLIHKNGLFPVWTNRRNINRQVNFLFNKINVVI